MLVLLKLNKCFRSYALTKLEPHRNLPPCHVKQKISSPSMPLGEFFAIDCPVHHPSSSAMACVEPQLLTILHINLWKVLISKGNLFVIENASTSKAKLGEFFVFHKYLTSPPLTPKSFYRLPMVWIGLSPL